MYGSHSPLSDSATSAEELPTTNRREPKVKQKKERRSVGRWYIGDLIGKGKYSWVHKGYDKQTGKCVALKFMLKAENNSWNERQCERIKAQIGALRHVRHSHVIKLYAHTINATYTTSKKRVKDCILLVMEYAAAGELFDIMYYTSALEATVARTYLRQLVSSIEACHKAGVAHRDIKPQNLLLDNGFNLKLSDFGLAKLFMTIKSDANDPTHIMYTTIGAKDCYQAPELLLQEPYDTACDIFSVGVVLFVLLNGYPPFEAARKEDRWYGPLARKDYREFWQMHHQCPCFNDLHCRDLIQRMLAYDPSERITLSQIKQSVWFQMPILNEKQLMHKLKRRYFKMEKQRQRVRTKSGASASTKRDYTVTDQHVPVANFPTGEIEGICDVYTFIEAREVYNTIYDMVLRLNGHSSLVQDSYGFQVLECAVKFQNEHMQNDSLVKFNVQCFRSVLRKPKTRASIIINDNTKNDSKLYVVRFHRLEGSTLDWKKMEREILFKSCGHVLTGLPQWASDIYVAQLKAEKEEIEKESQKSNDTTTPVATTTAVNNHTSNNGTTVTEEINPFDDTNNGTHLAEQLSQDEYDEILVEWQQQLQSETQPQSQCQQP